MTNFGGVVLKYNNIVEATFIDRPNRFIANVIINNKLEKVHVKNTGRCKEILKKGAKVYLEKSDNPNRKTKYSLISVFKEDMLINIDSQVPNDVVYSSILSNKIPEITDVDLLKREVNYKNSRFDLYFEKENKKGFIEVKGVTLEIGGISLFPDAPTKRGTKHIHDIVSSVEEGYNSFIFFLVQMPNINCFKPNVVVDKEFNDALILAKEEGVNILAYNSIVKPNEIRLGKRIKVII